MKKLIETIKGIGIGVANIIPGFSGGTMAVVFGLYEKLIYAFSHFFESPLKILKEMWGVLLGVVLGVVLAVFGITLLLDTYPVPTVLVFVGFVVGSIPKIQTQARLTSQEMAPKIAMAVGMALLLILTFLPFTNETQGEITLLFTIGLFFIGALGASSMVIPGVSGSLIFLVFGYYDYILTISRDFISALFSLDLALMGDTLAYIMIFTAGIVLGVVLIAKLIEKLMCIHKSMIYGFIVGLLVASPVAILVNLQREYPSHVSEGSWMTWFIGALLAVLGFTLSYQLGKKEETEGIEDLQEDL